MMKRAIMSDRLVSILQWTARLLIACLAMAAPTAWLAGASALDFPRLALESGSITGVAIVNPNTAAAEATATAYGSDGSVLAASQIQIPAGRQVSFLTTELFGSGFDPETMGWFQVSSATPGLTGFFLILNDQDTEFDGAELPIRSRRIVFDEIRADQVSSTELNIVNTSDVTVHIGLTLVAGDGEPIVRDLELAAKGAARLDLATLFDRAEVPPEAYVLAEASQDLTGFELIRTVGGDIEGLNARSATDLLNTIYFPQVRVLGPFVAQLGLTNLSDRAAIVTVTAHDADGGIFAEEARANPVALSLAPGGSLKRDLEELFGFRGDEPLEGWLEVRSTSTSITGYLELLTPETGAAATINAVSQGSTRALFSHLATSRGVFTGLALLNAASLTTDVRVAAVSASGQLLGTFDTALQPGQRISALVSDLIPEADGQAGGLLLVRSSVPIFSTSLFGSNQGRLLSNIPAQPVSDSFRPESNVPTPAVSPSLAVLFEGNSQTFRASQLGNDVRWFVNGVEGGSPAFGTIDGNGRYVAPPVAPTTLPVVVTAVAGSRSAGASIDVVSIQALASGVGQVQSLAFVGSLQRLFTAELSAVGGLAVAGERAVDPQQGVASGIYGMDSDGRRTLLIELQGEEVPKMIPFIASDDQEYLLVAGQVSGRVLRVDPRTGDTRVVARGLDSPHTLVLDPVTGNLLVAEATQITNIPRRQLDAGLASAALSATDAESPSTPTAVLAPISGVAGLAVDACTGKVFVSLASGQLLDLGRDGESRVIMDGLDQPGQMAGFYRTGVSCPDSFQLLVVEGAADQVNLVTPSTGAMVSPWAPATNARDIVTLPDGGAFQARVAFDTSTGSGAGSDDLMGLDLPGLYADGPINPLRSESTARSIPPGPDLAIGASNARPGSTASVNLFYRPGPADQSPGGSDETNALVFRLDYDESLLSFDATDANDDGVPDSVTVNTPPGFRVFIFFDPDAPEGELGIGIVNPSGLGGLPDDSLMTLNFRLNEASQGSANVLISRLFPPQAADTLGNRFPLDEAVDGSVSVVP